MAKELNYKMTLYQGGVEATFHLTKEEFEARPDRNNNFAWFAWADHDLSPAKRRRFNNTFDYHRGDFLMTELEHTIKRY